MFKAAKAGIASAARPAESDAFLTVIAPDTVAQPHDIDTAEVEHETAAADSQMVRSGAGSDSACTAAGNKAAVHIAAEGDTRQDVTCQPSRPDQQSCLEGNDVQPAGAFTSVPSSQAKTESEAQAQQQQHDHDDAAVSDSLNGVDLAEQKQIMHELWLEKNALSARNAAKRPAPAGKACSKRSRLTSAGKGKQTQLSAMLRKMPPP